MDLSQIKEELTDILNNCKEDSLKTIINMHINVCDELMEKNVIDDKVVKILEEALKVLK